MKRTRPTQEQLRQLFSYNDDGTFTRLVKTGNRTYVGDIVNTVPTSRGYRHTRVNGSRYKLHILIWIYHYGDIQEKMQIDHINGVRSDNRIENLRICTNAQNAQNRKMSISNRSGYIGVLWNARQKKWRSRIGIDGKLHHLGYFNDPEEAYKVYLEAKKKYHTFNPNVR